LLVEFFVSTLVCQNLHGLSVCLVSFVLISCLRFLCSCPNLPHFEGDVAQIYFIWSRCCQNLPLLEGDVALTFILWWSRFVSFLLQDLAIKPMGGFAHFCCLLLHYCLANSSLVSVAASALQLKRNKRHSYWVIAY